MALRGFQGRFRGDSRVILGGIIRGSREDLTGMLGYFKGCKEKGRFLGYFRGFLR